MKLVLSIVSLLGVVSFSTGQLLEPGKIFHAIGQLEAISSSDNPERAVFVLADIYHYANTATGISPKTHRNAAYYHELIDTIAIWLAKTHSVEIFAEPLRLLMTQIDNQVSEVLVKWHDEFKHKKTLGVEPFWMIEHFFLRQIKANIEAPNKSAAAFMYAIINGTGYCGIFEYPNEINLFTENFSKFKKIAYLMKVFIHRNLLPQLRRQDSHILALQKLALACHTYQTTHLDTERRKAFLAAIVKGSLRPINQLPTYVVGDMNTDICTKLELHGIYKLKKIFLEGQAIKLFVHECLDDLVQRLKMALDNVELRYRGSLISRWLLRLQQYVDRRPDHNDTFADASADNYLRRLVEEIPATDALLAYDKGAGLCSILDEEKFKTILHQLEYAGRICRAFKLQSLPITGIDMRNLDQFRHLRTVCLRRRHLADGQNEIVGKRKREIIQIN